MEAQIFDVPFQTHLIPALDPLQVQRLLDGQGRAQTADPSLLLLLHIEEFHDELSLYKSLVIT